MPIKEDAVNVERKRTPKAGRSELCRGISVVNIAGAWDGMKGLRPKNRPICPATIATAKGLFDVFLP